jgi:ABC-2 type transport system ATP-binding protein
VDLAGDGTYDLVRDTVVRLDLALVRVEQRRRQLEELFRAPVEEPTRAE